MLTILAVSTLAAAAMLKGCLNWGLLTGMDADVPVRAYIVNLARSSDRRQYIEAELRKTGVQYEVITAVDGQNLDLNDEYLIDQNARQAGWFRPGVAGCALSHLQVYRQVLADGARVALVLEDDVTLPADLEQLAVAVAAHMTGPEVALLNFQTQRPCLLSTVGSVALPHQRLLVYPVDPHQLTSGGAYLVTYEACESLSRWVLPVRARADDWGVMCDSGALKRVRCVYPLPVRKNFDIYSTMSYHGSGFRARLQVLARRQIPGVYQLLALRRKRIDQRWSRVKLVGDTPPHLQPHASSAT